MSTKAMTLDDIILCAILDALARHGGNITEASWELACSRKTIYNRLHAAGMGNEIPGRGRPRRRRIDATPPAA